MSVLLFSSRFQNISVSAQTDGVYKYRIIDIGSRSFPNWSHCSSFMDYVADSDATHILHVGPEEQC